MLQVKKAYAQKVAAAGLVQAASPEIPTLNRLEVDPVGDTYGEGLAARVADPLWLLTRQWQFGEFDGEDAGWPIQASYRLAGLPIIGYGPGADPRPADFRAFAAGDAPLEAMVEAEPLLVLGLHPRANAEAGQMLVRLAAGAGRPDVAAACRGAYPGYAGADTRPADPLSDPAGALWHLLLADRCIDAWALAADLRPLRAADGSLPTLPQPLLDAGLALDAAPVFAAWLDWADDFLFEPAANPAWLPRRQEYAFEVAVGSGGQRLCLDADEYVDGRVDWHDFDRRGPLPAHALANLDAVPLDDEKPRQSIPAQVQYPGMPAPRFWEFEDGQVNFARLQAGPLDLVRMMVAEYALVHGNDWFLVPARVRAGGLYRVQELTVTDTFGRQTAVQPVAGDVGRTWRLQGLSEAGGNADSQWLFVPPPLSDTLEGDPLEEVALVRDEMANLAWAIEKRVQGASGEPLDRALEDQRYGIRQQPTVATTDAGQLYRLMTPVPSHWLPLIPVRKAVGNLSLSIYLQRAGMKRFYRVDAAAFAAVDGYGDFVERLRNSPEFVEVVPFDPALPASGQDVQVFIFHPRGQLLRAGAPGGIVQDSLLIEEAEVPRAGAVVERRFNYARTADGRAWLWVGRRKRVGRGEAASGLAFDIAVASGQL